MAKQPTEAPDDAKKPDPPPRPTPIDEKTRIQALQLFHIEVALHHLKEVNPDLLPNDVLEDWGLLTNGVILLSATLEHRK